MGKYQAMQKALDEIVEFDWDSDAVISIWLGSLAAYNDGYLIGRWISLPTDEYALQKALDIVTEDGAHDFYIADHEGKFSGRIHESSDPMELNAMAEKLEDLEEIDIKKVEWLMDDLGYDFEEALERYEEVEVGSKESLAYDYIELKFSRSKEALEMFDEIVSYIDLDHVWNEIETSASTHKVDFETVFVWWW